MSDQYTKSISHLYFSTGRLENVIFKNLSFPIEIKNRST